MNRRLFVGNLPYSTTREQLADAFGVIGTVEETHLPLDKETNKPRGFGFVTMATAQEADAAVTQLHGSTFNGRTLTVNIAKPREPRNGNGYQSGRRDRDRDHRGGREARW